MAAVVADWSFLPAAAVVNILQHVDIKQRLTCCALVSTSWAAAATAATDSVVTRQLDSCSRWVEHSGAHITSLHVLGPLPGAYIADMLPDHVISQLPRPLLAHLVELRIGYHRLQLAPSSSSPGVLQHAGNIQRLFLDNCYLEDEQQGLSAIPAAMPALEDLAVLGVQRNRETAVQVPEDFFPALKQLTSLHMKSMMGSEVVLPHLSSLSRLKHLHLGFGNSTDLQGLQQLAQLTALIFDHFVMRVSLASTPWMSQLTVLNRLQLKDCGSMDVSLMQPLTRLQHVKFDNVKMLLTPGHCELFPWLSKQQELTHLEICSVFDPSDLFKSGGVLALASSIHHLHLDLPVDHRVWPQGFPSSKQLHRLTSLAFLVSPEPRPGEGPDWSAMVQCCPYLQSLSITEPVISLDDYEALDPWAPAPQPLGDMSPLSQLQHLTDLKLAYGTDTVTSVLAQMTQLVRLDLASPNGNSDLGLLCLTALKRLTSFEAWQNSPGAALMDSDGNRQNKLFNKAAWNEPPDVWAQLLQCCRRSAGCRAHIKLLEQV